MGQNMEQTTSETEPIIGEISTFMQSDANVLGQNASLFGHSGADVLGQNTSPLEYFNPTNSSDQTSGFWSSGIGFDNSSAPDKYENYPLLQQAKSIYDNSRNKDNFVSYMKQSGINFDEMKNQYFRLYDIPDDGVRFTTPGRLLDALFKDFEKQLGGRPFTRGRKQKMNQFTKGRNRKLRKTKETRKTYRKKYKTRRR
jgi:hypothetical protein